MIGQIEEVVNETKKILNKILEENKFDVVREEAWVDYTFVLDVELVEASIPIETNVPEVNIFYSPIGGIVGEMKCEEKEDMMIEIKLSKLKVEEIDTTRALK